MSKESVKEEHPPEEILIFICELCNLKENYHYYGKRPRFCRRVQFLEDCYIMKDPFSAYGSNNYNVLVLGGDCSHCHKSVCQTCSIYYSKRYCKDCIKLKHIASNLPNQLLKTNSSLD